MSSEALREAHKLRGLTPKYKAIVIALAGMHNVEGPLVVKHATLARKLLVPRRTLARHLDHLRRKGIISTRRCREPGWHHLCEFHLSFLDAERQDVPDNRCQNSMPNRRRDRCQNGRQISNRDNYPSKAPDLADVLEVSFNDDPELFGACCNVLSKDPHIFALQHPVYAFNRVVVERVQRKLLQEGNCNGW